MPQLYFPAGDNRCLGDSLPTASLFAFPAILSTCSLPWVTRRLGAGPSQIIKDYGYVQVPAVHPALQPGSAKFLNYFGLDFLEV